MSETSTHQDSFTCALSVEQSPEEVFRAIANPRGWWSENIDGTTDRLGEQFTYRHKDIHRCVIRVSEMTRPALIVWTVVENSFTFTDDATEWTGTEIRFDIARKGAKTELRFTHVGLVPAYECFDVCSNSWDFYLRTSLLGLIHTGRGLPNPAED
jgi:hypothetical protein